MTKEAYYCIPLTVCRAVTQCKAGNQHTNLKPSELQVVCVICNCLWKELMYNYKSALRAGGCSFHRIAWIHLLISFRTMYSQTQHTNEHYRQFSLKEKFIWIWPQKVSISIRIRSLYWSVYAPVSSVTNVGLRAHWCTIYVRSSPGVFLRDGLYPIWNWCHHGLICIPDSMDLLPSFSSLSSTWLNVFPSRQYLVPDYLPFPWEVKITHLFLFNPPPVPLLQFRICDLSPWLVLSGQYCVCLGSCICSS